MSDDAKNTLLYSIIALIIFIIGVLIGREIPSAIHIMSTPQTPPIPVLKLISRDGSVIKGHINGSLRVVMNGTDSIENSHLYSSEGLKIDIPWMQIPSDFDTFGALYPYVANTRTMRFYTINSATGRKIKPYERVYFMSKEDAISAGYSDKKPITTSSETD